MENLIYSVNESKSFTNLQKQLHIFDKFNHINGFVNYFFENREKISKIRDILLSSKVDFKHFGYENVNKFFPILTFKEIGNKKTFIIESDKTYLMRIKNLTQGDLIKAQDEVKNMKNKNVNSLVQEEYSKLLNNLKSDYFEFEYDIVFDRLINKIYFIFSSRDAYSYEEFNNYQEFNIYLKNLIDSRREYELLMQEINENKNIKYKISYMKDGFLLENNENFSQFYNFRQLKSLKKVLLNELN